MSAPESTGRPEPRNSTAVFLVLIAISSLSPLGINIVVPSMPSLQRTFGVDYGVAQLSLSLFLASMAVFLIVTGPLSDMFGRRPVLFAGLGVFLAATLAAGMAPNIGVHFAGRIAEAAGAGAGIVIGRAMVGDIYERARAASMMGYVTMGYGIAPMLGPVIGGAIDQWLGWRASFYFLAGLGVIVAFLAWRVLPETVQTRGPDHDGPTFLGALAELAAVPAFWAIAFGSALASAVYFTLLGAGAFVSENFLHLSPAAFGSYFILIAAGYMSGNWFTGRYAGHFGSMHLVEFGGYIILVATAAIAFAAIIGALDAVTLFVPTFFIGIANGLVTPNCMALVISLRPRLAGTAVGMATGLQLGFGGLVSTVVGWWIAVDPSVFPMVAQMVIAAVLAVLLIALAGRLLGQGQMRASEGAGNR